MAYSAISFSDKYYFLDTETKKVREDLGYYDSIEEKDYNYFVYSKGGKFGIYDFEMEEVLPPVYDGIEFPNKNVVIVNNDNLYTLLDPNFEVLIKGFNDFELVNDSTLELSINDKKVMIVIEDPMNDDRYDWIGLRIYRLVGYGIIEPGNYTPECIEGAFVYVKRINADFGSFFLTEEDGFESLYYPSEDLLIDGSYDRYYIERGGYVLVANDKDKTLGLFKDGDMLLPCKYTAISNIKKDLCYVLSQCGGTQNKKYNLCELVNLNKLVGDIGFLCVYFNKSLKYIKDHSRSLRFGINENNNGWCSLVFKNLDEENMDSDILSEVMDHGPSEGSIDWNLRSYEDIFGNNPCMFVIPSWIDDND